MSTNYFFSKDELLESLKIHINPVIINRIIDAYDMADQAYGDKKTLNGDPYFFHTTRVCKILVTELNIFDSELIIATLLHDIYKTAEDLSDKVIALNFGDYVAFLISVLRQDYEFINYNQFIDENDEQIIRIPLDDYLIIWLSEHLDNLRFLEFNTEFNPINYVLNISNNYFPIAEKSENPQVEYLLKELKKERNRILC
jgi:(p)ppGpp synthase/HD superfamily hydrolase